MAIMIQAATATRVVVTQGERQRSCTVARTPGR